MAPMDTTIGALFVSSMSGFFFGGIVVVHAWRYFAMWPNDSWIIKSCVILTLLCTFSVMLLWPTWAYLWGVTHWGDPTIMANVPWTFPVGIILIGIGAVFVHVFYSWRLFIVARATVWRWILPTWIICNSLGQLLAMFITAAAVLNNASLVDLPRIFTAAYIWMGCSMAAGSVGITFGLLYFLLWRTRNSIAYSQAHRSFLRICLQAIENNVLSLFLQIFLALMMTRGPGFWWTLVDTSMLSVYAFSLLLSLNSRNPSNHGNYSTSPELPSASYGGGGRSTYLNAKRSAAGQGIQVSVSEERHTESRSNLESQLGGAAHGWEHANKSPVAVVFNNRSQEVEKLGDRKLEEHELGSI